MRIDRERRQQVRDGVAELRRLSAEAPLAHGWGDDNVRYQNLAEILAVVVAQAREAGADETLWVEILLADGENDRQTLLETRQTLAALGYAEVADLLKRLVRRAPRRLTFRERMAEKARRVYPRSMVASEEGRVLATVRK